MLNKIYDEICRDLEMGIIPFWSKNGIDKEYGGYLTCFDEQGNPTGDTDKYIIIQTRMIWGLSKLAQHYPEKPELLEQAKQGVDFFIKYFWDTKNGGWFWKVKRDGTCIDDGKVVYGQTFAIYALAQYAISAKDAAAQKYAEDTFDLLQKYCADTLCGGYFENLENDWSISEPGFAAGDRKSLDIHMHMMEALTTLAELTQKEIHKRKLKECIDVILTHMIDYEYGCGKNQFKTDFTPIPAINIRRTWNAERATGEVIETPTDTTSFGHNLELIWLINYAADVLGIEPFVKETKLLSAHAVKYGIDHELGGVYRDGTAQGEVLVYDKEWWQNCEALVGLLDVYEVLGNEEYLELFNKNWEFDKKYFINDKTGEWRQLLKKDGSPIITDIGNPWKAIYHTGRAMLECKLRLEKILNK